MDLFPNLEPNQTANFWITHLKPALKILPPPLSSVSSWRRVSLPGSSIRSAFSKPPTNSSPDGPRPTGAGTPVMTVGIILMVSLRTGGSRKKFELSDA